MLQCDGVQIVYTGRINVQVCWGAGFGESGHLVWKRVPMHGHVWSRFCDRFVHDHITLVSHAPLVAEVFPQHETMPDSSNCIATNRAHLLLFSTCRTASWPGIFHMPQFLQAIGRWNQAVPPWMHQLLNIVQLCFVLFRRYGAQLAKSVDIFVCVKQIMHVAV